VSSNVQDRLRELLKQASEESDSEKVKDLLEDIYRLLDGLSKESKPAV
jgi:hypothetical protein